MNSIVRKPIYYSAWTFCVLFPVMCGCLGLNTFFKTLDYVILLVLAELILRIVQVFEFNAHLKKREVISKRIIRKIWKFNYFSLCTIFGITCYLLQFGLPDVLFEYQSSLPLICGYIFIKMVEFNESDYMKNIWIENSNGLDYGSGMAHSYFYGYLNILLPNRGDENFALKELMEIYESTENIKFSVKKIFLLIPRSLYCPPNLSEISKGPMIYMEGAKSLESIQRNRAGVKSRIYQNSVYKIHVKEQNGPVYVVAEGATPLLTFYETLKINGMYQKFYKENIDEIILQFHDTLKLLIENNIETKNLCELIYYDDLTSEINIGEILLSKISEIQNNERAQKIL